MSETNMKCTDVLGHEKIEKWNDEHESSPITLTCPKCYWPASEETMKELKRQNEWRSKPISELMGFLVNPSPAVRKFLRDIYVNDDKKMLGL